MMCPDTAEITALAFALANGDVADRGQMALLRHAGACPECQRDLQETQALVQRFRAADRGEATGTCLSDNALAELVDGVLTPVEQETAERHLAHCGKCLTEYVDLAKLVGEVAAPRPAEVVLRLFHKGLQILGNVEHSPLQPVQVLDDRLEEQACRWIQREEGLELEFTAYHTSLRTLNLAVAVADTGDFQPPLRLNLRRENHLYQSEMLPESGQTAIDDLSAGVYQVQVLGAGGRSASFDLRLESGE
jgi:anti-sigma factor RsiW